ncbi:hypothetical protein [Burkholderia gladioli]|uniref:hypothetical protein n=1 Tax=Burkholderia gladioli TaxID=28095 RepID=UPI0034DB6348
MRWGDYIRGSISQSSLVYCWLALSPATRSCIAGSTIQEAVCMARARRKIQDPHAVRPNALTEEVLRRICALHKIDDQIWQTT